MSVWLFATPWTMTHEASLTFTVSWSLLKLMCMESMMPSNHLILFSCSQSFPASGSFPISQLSASGGQRIEFQLQHQSFQWIFRIYLFLDWLAWSPCSPRDSQDSSPTNTTFQKRQFFGPHLSYGPILTSIHDYWKSHNSNYTDLCWQSDVSSLLFNMLSRLVIDFLLRSNCLLISLQSPSAVILEPYKINSVTVSIVSPPHLFAMKQCDQMPLSWFFECWVLSQLFHFLLSLSSRGSLVPLHFLP